MDEGCAVCDDSDGIDLLSTMLTDGRLWKGSCDSVLNPGTVIGSNTTVYPLSRVRGYVPANHIFKDPGNVVEKY